MFYQILNAYLGALIFLVLLSFSGKAFSYEAASLSSKKRIDSFHVYYCTHSLKRTQSLSEVLNFGHKTYGFQLGLKKLVRTDNAHVNNFNKIKIGTIVKIPLVTSTPEGTYPKGMSCRAYVFNDRNIIVKERGSKLLHVDNKLFFKTGFSYIDGQNITVPLSKEMGEPIVRAPSGVLNPVSLEKPSPLKGAMSLTVGASYESIHSPLPLPTQLISEVQPTLGVALSRYWSKHWETHLRAQWTQQAYTQSEGGSISLPKSQFNSLNLNFGIRYLWEHGTSVEFNLGFGDMAYYKQQSASAYRIATGKTLSTNVIGMQRFCGNDKLNFGAVLGVGFKGASYKDSTSFKGGIDYTIGLQTEYFYDRNSLSLSVLYKEGQYRSNFSNFEKRWLTTTFTYRVGF